LIQGSSRHGIFGNAASIPLQGSGVTLACVYSGGALLARAFASSPKQTRRVHTNRFASRQPRSRPRSSHSSRRAGIVIEFASRPVSRNSVFSSSYPSSCTHISRTLFWRPLGRSVSVCLLAHRIAQRRTPGTHAAVVCLDSHAQHSHCRERNQELQIARDGSCLCHGASRSTLC